ncbi:hypothetical protein AgCh_000916 [Apium graveolens]
MSNYGPPDIRQRPGCLTNLSGNSGLPAEMMDLILLRLPVKYLLRCRAVSKPWCIIIDSLSFLKRHLQRSIDCCHDTAAVFKHPCEAPSHLAVFYVADVGSLYDTKFKPKPKSHEDITALPVVGEASPGQASQGQASQGAASRKRKVRKGKSRKGKDPVVEPVSCYLADDDSVCELVSVDMNKIFEFGLSEPQLVGSCNGLVCVWNQHHKYGSSIYIWNPATRKSRRLPKHVNCRHVPFPHLLLGSSIVGFGYDSLHHDYKVVTSIDSNYFGRNFGVLLMSVFSLSGSSWRRIQPITNDYHIDVQKFGTYANVGSVDNHYVDIWLMNNSGGDWVKLFAVDTESLFGSLEVVLPFAFSKSRRPILLQAGDNKLYWYDHVKNEVEKVGINGLEEDFMMLAYMESFIDPGKDQKWKEKTELQRLEHKEKWEEQIEEEIKNNKVNGYRFDGYSFEEQVI